jgi:hypothetical protein
MRLSDAHSRLSATRTLGTLTVFAFCHPSYVALKPLHLTISRVTFLLGLFFDPEYEGDMFFGNVG